VTKQHINIFLW